MKNFICLCLVICLIACINIPAMATQEPEYTITNYKDEESEQFLWETLNKYSPSDLITAAVLAYFCMESNYKSDAVVNWPIQNIIYKTDFCQSFTNEIDAGLIDGSTRQYFIDECHNKLGGYGLGQWYAIMYLEEFYDFAQRWGTSIADAEMQCVFTLWSCSYWREPTWNRLLECKTATEAGRIIGYGYDGSTNGAEIIACKAEQLYKKYAE